MKNHSEITVCKLISDKKNNKCNCFYDCEGRCFVLALCQASRSFMMVSSMRCGVEEVERTELLEILILGLLAVGLGIAMLNIQGRSFCVEKTQERSAQKDRPRVSQIDLLVIEISITRYVVCLVECQKTPTIPICLIS